VLLAKLDRANVDRGAVAILDVVGSGMSVAISDNAGDYGAVIVSGANLRIAPEQMNDNLLSKAKILVLQNEVPGAVNEAVARRARERGVTTILNAAPARPFTTALPNLVDVLIVNAIEAEMLDGGPVSALETAARAAERLGSRFPTAIVTAGGAGVAYF
jgi:ribokinase